MANSQDCTDVADTPKRVEDVYTIDFEYRLGFGAHGTVYKAICKSDGSSVAIKIVSALEAKAIQVENQLLPVEVHLMKKLAHVPGVIRFRDWFKTGYKIHIVMDFHESACSFDKYLLKKLALPEAKAKVFFKKVVEAFLACHIAGVSHGDVREDNLLIDEKHERIYVIDFGCGSLLSDLPPNEFRDGKKHVDGGNLQKYETHPETINRLSGILSEMVEFKNSRSNVSADYTDLVLWCRQDEVDERPSLEDILEHQWFKDIDNDEK